MVLTHTMTGMVTLLYFLMKFPQGTICNAYPIHGNKYNLLPRKKKTV